MYYEVYGNKDKTILILPGWGETRNTFMDMMFMDDAIDAVIKLLHADPDRLTTRNAFNVSAMSIEPEMVAESIRKHIPDFKINYDVDPERQKIAETWPNSLDVSEAKKQWDFSPKYDLDKMTEVMLENVSEKLKQKTR